MRIFYCLFFLFCLKPDLIGLNKNISGDTLYMVVGIKETDQTSISSLKSQLESNTNCKVLMFCENLNVFVLMFTNNEGQVISDIFADTEKKINNGIKLYLKEGKVKDILSSCYFTESQITPEIKTLLSN
jgi:hypothetical protein